MGKEVCQRCGEYDYDTRTLWMACFYAMSELGLPLEECSLWGRYCRKESEKKLEAFPGVTVPNWGEPEGNESHHGFYTLRVCKDCRGSWMDAIKGWFERGHGDREACGSGIFVRRYGANVEISREEWDSLNPGREPVTVTRNIVPPATCGGHDWVIRPVDADERKGHVLCAECAHWYQSSTTQDDNEKKE